MAVWIEPIALTEAESFRLLSWGKHSRTLQALDGPNRLRRIEGAGARWHSHPEMEFTLITQGLGLRYVGDSAEPFKPLDCVLIGSNLPHCWIEREHYSGYVLHFRFPPNHGIWQLGCREELRELFTAAGHGLTFGPERASAALGLLEKLGNNSGLARVGLLLELLALLSEGLRHEARRLSEQTAPGGTASPRMEAVVQWVLTSFTESLTLVEALSRAGMSRATFARHFRKHTGRTFVEFLNHVRLAHAHQQLATTNLSVAEIAYASGFNSLSHFGLLFRKRYGTTPRLWASQRSPVR